MENQTKIIIGAIIIAGIIIYIYKDDIKTYFDYKKDSPKIDLIKNKPIDKIDISNFSDL